MVAVVAQRLGRGLDPGHVAVVVLAPDEDDALVAAAELLEQIARCRRRSRWAPRHRSSAGSLDPCRRRTWSNGRRPRRPPRRRRRRPAASRSPWRPSRRRGACSLSARRRNGSPGARGWPRCRLEPARTPSGRPPRRDPRRGPGLGQDFGRQLLRHVVDVVAAVAVVGDVAALPDGHDRCAQVLDLAAEVVEVVLARDGVAGGGQDAAQQVAGEGAAGVADVQRPGGVGRDELHVDALGVGGGDAAPGGGLGAGCAAWWRPERASERRMFRNPGGATSTAAMGEAGSMAVVVTWAAIALAISSGGRR